MKLSLTCKKVITIVMLCTPFIDILNSIISMINVSFILSVGQMIRAILWIFMLIVLNKKHSNSFILIAIICVGIFLRNILYYCIYNAQIFLNVSWDLRYIYVLTFGLLLYRAYAAKAISTKEIYELVKKNIAIVAIVTATSNLLGIGIEYAGTKRMFTEVNALTAVLVWSTSIWLYELFIIRFTLKKLAITLITVYATFSMATKTGVIGVMICLSYLFFCTGMARKKFAKWICLFLAGGIGICGIYFYFTSGSGIDVLQRWKYFYDKFDIISFLLSGRNSLLNYSFQVWKSDLFYILFGVSYSNAYHLLQKLNLSYVGSEMDFFDVFFYYGIIAFVIIYPIFKRFIASLKGMFGIKKENNLKFSFVLICVISFLGGHILSSPMAGIIFCASFVMTLG